MARGRARARARSKQPDADAGRTTTRGGRVGGMDGSVVPRVLLGAVDGVEIVAVGALQLARDVLLSVVSGAANIGAEALTATAAGARGVVSATSFMVGDLAGTAQGTFVATIDSVRRSRRGPARLAPRRRASPMIGEAGETVTPAPPPKAPRSRRRARRLRPAPRPSIAA
jgi:hypothetical protein